MTIKGLHFVTKRRPGQPVIHYVYAWRGGPCIMRKEGGKRPTLGPKETAAYNEALADTRAVRPTSLAGLVRDFRAPKCREWERLADNTKRTWGPILDKIEAKWGQTPLTLWNDPRMVTKVIAWRDAASGTPRAADNRVTVLRSLLEWGRLHGRVTVNVAAKIPQLYEGGDRAEIIWLDSDIERFAAVAPLHVMDGLRLAALTGLRRADLVGLVWDEVGSMAIVRKALKKSKRKRRTVTVPLIAETKALLDELRSRQREEGVQTVLVNSYGKAWTGDGFGNCFIRCRAAAGIVHDDGRVKHLHDVRGTFATKLILAGLTNQETGDIMGWSPERVAGIRKVYVDQARVVIGIAERMEAGGV